MLREGRERGGRTRRGEGGKREEGRSARLESILADGESEPSRWRARNGWSLGVERRVCVGRGRREEKREDERDDPLLVLSRLEVRVGEEEEELLELCSESEREESAAGKGKEG